MLLTFRRGNNGVQRGRSHHEQPYLQITVQRSLGRLTRTVDGPATPTRHSTDRGRGGRLLLCKEDQFHIGANFLECDYSSSGFGQVPPTSKVHLDGGTSPQVCLLRSQFQLGEALVLRSLTEKMTASWAKSQLLVKMGNWFSAQF